MSKKNCWEFMKCGREPGGIKANESGVCPIAACISASGLNEGVNGGRICWVMVETFSDHHDVKCSPFHHSSSCFSCEFRYKVLSEEGLLNVCNATGKLIHQEGVNKKQ